MRRVCGWLGVKHASHVLGLESSDRSGQGSVRMPCCVLLLCGPHDVAVVAVMRLTTTSSYCFVSVTHLLCSYFLQIWAAQLQCSLQWMARKEIEDLVLSDV